LDDKTLAQQNYPRRLFLIENSNRLLVDFEVHKSIIHTIKEFKDFSPSICTLTHLATENFDMVLINVHASTKDKDEKEKELFYSTLEDIFNTS